MELNYDHPHVEGCVACGASQTSIATIAFFNCHLATIMDVVHVDEATGQKTPVQSRKRKRKASQTVELEEEHQVTGKERLESEAAVKKVRQHVDGH